MEAAGLVRYCQGLGNQCVGSGLQQLYGDPEESFESFSLKWLFVFLF